MFNRVQKSNGIAKPGDTPPRSPIQSTELTTAPSRKPAEMGAKEGVVIIGKGTRVIGQVNDCVLLDVHGVLEADVITEHLIVRSGGGVQGNIQTGGAEIHGIVEGHLAVEGHLDIRATGQITGDVSYDTMAAEVGGRIRGNIQVREAPSDPIENTPWTDPVNGEKLDMSVLDGTFNGVEVH